jgi:hypothetical protein
MTFWESVSDLRRIEFIVILVTMILPIISGTVLLTIRQRIKTIHTQSTRNQGTTYQENVQALQEEKERQGRELANARGELSILRHVTAPRKITEAQEIALIDHLSGVKAAPVIVSAYAFEEESAAYAEQIVLVLRKAGWQASLNKTSMNDFKGISLGTINLTRKPIVGLHELAQAFTAARLELRQRETAPDSIAGQLQDGSLLVVVGRK